MGQSDNHYHYRGLIADWYDLLLFNEQNDIELYLNLVQNSGAPALELACGTGRVLMELLLNGIQTDGLDVSKAMLAKCKIHLKESGLFTKLYHQPMEQMELDDTYKTIYAPNGALQLIEDRHKLRETLNRIYDSLQPGGCFFTDLFIPWDEIRKNADGVWIQGPHIQNSTDRLAVSYSLHHDLTDQLQSGWYRYEHYTYNQLITTETERFNLRWYSIDEFAYMLKIAGFEDITAENCSTLSNVKYSTLYKARKPE